MKRLMVVLLLILVVLLGIWVWVLARSSSNLSSGEKPSAFSAVYLSTGDIYFGKLSWFPRVKLTDASLLQRVSDGTQENSYALVPFRSAIWQPIGTLYLNKKQIVFWAHVRAGSETEQKLILASQTPISTPQASSPSSGQ